MINGRVFDGTRLGSGRIRRGWFAGGLLAIALGCPAGELDLGGAKLALDRRAVPGTLRFGDGTEWITNNAAPLFSLESGGRRYAPESVEDGPDGLSVLFEDGSRARFAVEPGHGFTLFRLKSLDLRTSASRLGLFRFPAPPGSEISDSLNACFSDTHVAAVMAADPDVHAFFSHSGARQADRADCDSDFSQTTESRAGKYAARFVSRCGAEPGGWSMKGRPLPQAVDISDWAGVSAWVRGDGQGQQLKIQFDDGQGGARDYYIPVDFTGWRRVEATSASLDTLRSPSLTGINIYYNGVPAAGNVMCLLDDIRGIVRRPGQEPTTVSVEDFEDTDSPWWTGSGRSLNAETLDRFGLEPAAFGVIACPGSEFFEAVERFEKAAAIPSARPGGIWNKRSSAVRESYLFLTSFGENQFDDALALARRGGFKRVLLGQESWCASTGHFEINRKGFPEGIASLKRVVRRFREAGIECGLHVLAASIYPPDPYLTPVPDPRLLKGARVALAADLDAASTTVLVRESPQEFPGEDGGYTGQGTVLQIGEELIAYEARSTTAPFSFTGCRRGHLGTRTGSHASGGDVRHLTRAYGYHMYDMDTSLLDEVASNFAAAANGCEAGMVYFDGAERLQGDHWRYNARLIKAFHDRLDRKDDVLLQASSFSHYSWHLLWRTASADGHGDLKGYLEERSPYFSVVERDCMPLDIGWYYGYDASATPDMYEYILGATIGYGSSMSYQVSVPASAAHPFTGEIFDLVARYERLRLSGRTPEPVKSLLRVAKSLQGQAPEAPDRPLGDRRDYRLIETTASAAFQRVVYEPWQEMTSGVRELYWRTDVTTGPVRTGLQVQVLPGAAGQELEDIRVEIGGKRLEWSGKLTQGQYLFIWPGERAMKYGLPLSAPADAGLKGPEIELAPGTHQVRLGREKTDAAALRVRLTHQPPERHVLP